MFLCRSLLLGCEDGRTLEVVADGLPLFHGIIIWRQTPLHPVRNEDLPRTPGEDGRVRPKSEGVGLKKVKRFCASWPQQK